MKTVSLIPYVCGAGASQPGSEQGSLYARAHGLRERLATKGIDALWAIDPDSHWAGPYGRSAHENLPARGSAERFEIVSWHIQALAQNVMAELGRGRRVITIGGDHSMAAGSIAGAHRALGGTVGVIWVDAHPDINTFQSSVSKALHGMQMASLLGMDPILALDGEMYPVLKPENIVFAGLRSIDPPEFTNADQIGLKLMTMEELRERGVAETLQEAALDLSTRCDHILLSIDLDGFALDVAPAVGSPVPGGFTPDEILPVLAGIVRTHGVPLIEIVEFNPTLPGAEKTFDLIVQILGMLLPD